MSETLVFATDADAASTKMRGWVVHKETHDPQDLKLETVNIPTPAPHEVLVRVAFAGTNPVDYKRMGFPGMAYPAVIGSDLAGTVVALGDKVDASFGLTVGSRVCTFGPIHRAFGSYAEYIPCDARILVKVPDGVALNDAAGVPCAAWTAYMALFDKLRLQAGQTILITAGAGGVGSYAIQLAKHAGARVISTCSAYNVPYLNGLGVDLVVDYTKENVVERVKEWLGPDSAGLDCVFDCVSPANAVESAKALRFDGAVCGIVGSILGDTFFNTGVSAHHVIIPGYHNNGALMLQMREVGEKVLALIANRKILPAKHKVVPFEDAVSVLESLKSGHSTGKTVLIVSPDA